MKEVGRGQSLKIFPRVCIQDFLKGCMWISRARKESRMTPRFVSVEGAGWDGEGWKLSIGHVKLQRPTGRCPGPRQESKSCQHGGDI